MGFVLALVIGLDVAEVLRQPNRVLQDALVASQGHDVRDGDVIVVAIDENSLSALGRWPWRRTVHAALIDRIMQDAPRAIGFDLLLAEPDTQHPGDDAALAAAMQRSGKVVLPMTMQSYGRSPETIGPACPFKGSAARMGLGRLPVDSDGIFRNVYLREGFQGVELDHFSLATLLVGEPGRSASLPGSPRREELLHAPPSDQWLDWRRSHKMIVPFAGPPGQFRRISYIDVLKGSIPPDTFRGKYVLVGTTAAELGDMYATPVAGREQLMPGVEIHANMLDGLLSSREMTPAPAWLRTGLNVSVVLVALAGMAFLEPLSALMLTGALALLLTLATGAFTALLRVQFSPAAGILGLCVSYASWNWWRLNAATRYLIDASTQLRASVGIVPHPTDGTRPPGDFLDRRIRALAQATEHLRDLHQFVGDSLNNLPDAKLVCDRRGEVRLANAAAARYFNVATGEALSGMSAIELMRHVHSSDDHHPVITPDVLAQQPAADAVSARDNQDHDLLVKRSPLLSANGQHIGWILSLIDVTEMRQAQRQRDDAMHFLSHDIRAPQAAILTLLEFHQHDPAAMTQAQFQERIERHAHKALALSESFIQLVRAQSQPYRLATCNLADILLECIDDTWEARRRNRIQVVIDARSLQEVFSRADRDLVSRAIDNLLGNALKHAPAHSAIICAVEPHEDGWAIRVQDQGPGIASDKQASIFEPFARGGRPGSRTDGAGLGLAFVKTVAARHGGQISLQSVPGEGCTFRFVLPKAATSLA